MAASAALVALLSVSSACAPGSPESVDLELRPCTIGGVEAECGRLSVPENPHAPDGPRIRISVALVRARESDPAPDPLFYLAGWGSAGIEDDMGAAAPMLGEINEQRDLVFIDQRGTGGSNRLDCSVPTEREIERTGLRAYTEAARTCAEEIGPNLRYYTSSVAVDDVDRVREALGYERINIYGGSYGVTLGLIYLQRHGSHVRSAVFDSGSLLDVHIFERAAVGGQRALEMLFDRCEADPRCGMVFPDLRDEWERLAARVESRSIAVPGRQERLDPIMLAGLVEELLSRTPTKTILPRVIHLLATGEIETVAEMFPPTSPPTEEPAYMALIQCSEPWASRRPPHVARLSEGTFMEPLLRRAAAITQATCRALPRGEAPAEIGRRVRSDVPVLFLTGDEDPADPPANVARARRELPNSLTVVFPEAGHGQLELPCAQDLVSEFVRAGSSEGLNTSCAATAALLPFDTRT
ncbi:MAG TPA: alpha/beta hydrolase [Actinomycetota bacterium]